MDWPHGPELFAHLRNLPGPLRLDDLPGYVRSLGFSHDLTFSRTLQATPMRHRGAHVGTFFLGEKEGDREFTDKDEEILVLFASQAATAIANARTHRDEQRARADLEALVETSPVGVIVLDAATGRPKSFNREARRIVEVLLSPGRPPEQLLEVLTCRFTDGREIALDQLPLAQALGNAETVRAEEIVISVPDGRSVTTLLNVTPICGEGGAVESVVVTMQDLAPFEELGRQRSEFIGLVSHELRAPLTSIKGSAATVLGAARVLDPAEVHQFFRIIDAQANHMDGLIGDLLDAGRIDTGTLSVAPQPSDVASLVDEARNTFLSGGGRHSIFIDLPPDLPQALADRRRIVQVLEQPLLKRRAPLPAVNRDSGRRSARRRSRRHLRLRRRPGRGARSACRTCFENTRAAATGESEFAGSGLGLAICKGLVEAHGGRISAASAGAGQGTSITFTVPLYEPVGERAAPHSADGSRRAPGDAQQPEPILVVDDDPQTLRYVREALVGAGYAPIVTGEHRELARIIETEKPRLVLLDLILPDTDGIALMEQLPELTDVPVIFISGYDRDETIVKALESGAADYLVKPFSPSELTARIRAVLRRRAESEPFVHGKLVIHYERRRVTIAGRAVPLTATEYELLRVLSVNAGKVMTYEALLRQVWNGRRDRDTDLVRTFVKKLRRKLGENTARPAWIFNERGVGYRMPRPNDL